MAKAEEVRAIVCIGWGSLVWKPDDLPIRGPWNKGGPQLPIEFARQSIDGRITLVICPGWQRVPTRWAIMDVPDLCAAKRALAIREWKNALSRAGWIEDNIGFWDGSSQIMHGAEANVVAEWASAKGFAAAVWTNLPRKFNGKTNVMPSEEEVVEALCGLSEEQRILAAEYIKNAPPEVETRYRNSILQKLGWS